MIASVIPPTTIMDSGRFNNPIHLVGHLSFTDCHSLLGVLLVFGDELLCFH